MSDATATVASLKARMASFVADRSWQRFHTPKNLAMSLAIEAAEVMEHFQWVDGDGGPAATVGSPAWAEVRDEVADVLCYLVALAGALDIDLDAAMQDKMRKNEEKYPADVFRAEYEWGDRPRPPSA